MNDSIFNQIGHEQLGLDLYRIIRYLFVWSSLSDGYVMQILIQYHDHFQAFLLKTEL